MQEISEILTWVILEGHIVVLYSKASGTRLLKILSLFVILHALLLKGMEWYSVPIFISKLKKKKKAQNFNDKNFLFTDDTQHYNPCHYTS